VDKETDPVIILGPTAVGKSALAISLAQKTNGEIISADSMQVYRGMDIGTAKPTLEERQGIPHHLIDIKDPNEEWTVSDFIERANGLIGKLANEGKTPIIVGGTGLYLWSLIEGFSFPITPADKELREKLEIEPLEKLYADLLAADPAAAAKIHPNDKKRIIRALEVFQLTGQPISILQKNRMEPEAKRLGSINKEPRSSFAGSSFTIIGLDINREELYQRINARVDRMMEKGLIDEVKGLRDRGYGRDLPSMQALGYKEVIGYLDGEYTEAAMIEELKKRTRNFARRQMTWFKRFKDVKWLNPDEALNALTRLVSE
jgi:tRNA dimethylallyltransferase